MRILISALRFFPGRTYGAEVYFYSLLHGLNHELQSADNIAVLGSAELCRWVSDVAPNTSQIPKNIPGPTTMSLLYEWMMVEQVARKWKADVVFFPFNIMPSVRCTKSVLMLHDIVSYFYADNFPDYAPIHNKILRFLIKHSVQSADVIITPSRAVVDEVTNIFPHDAEKAIVIHEAPAVRQVNAEPINRFDADGKYLLLQTGAKLPHKSQHTGIEAIAFIKEQNKELAQQVILVITGGNAMEIETLQAKAASLGVENNVELLGKVSDGLLESLLNQAILHLFPTLYEGFGLGVVESQKKGKVVVASKIPVLEEVSGGVGRFFKPGDGDDLGRVIMELLKDSDQRSYLEKEGKLWAERWGWNDHARELLNAMRQMVRG